MIITNRLICVKAHADETVCIQSAIIELSI